MANAIPIQLNPSTSVDDEDRDGHGVGNGLDRRHGIDELAMLLVEGVLTSLMLLVNCWSLRTVSSLWWQQLEREPTTAIPIASRN